MKAKEKYEKSLEELNKCTPQYMESMEQVFDQCQQHEVKRLTFLKEALLDIKRHLNLTENQRLVRTEGATVLLLFQDDWTLTGDISGYIKCINTVV